MNEAENISIIGGIDGPTSIFIAGKIGGEGMAFQVTAIALLLLFYGCYFLKMFQQQKKGIQTDQIGKGKTGVARQIEIIMKIATFTVPMVEVISIFLNTSFFPEWVRFVGVIVGMFGVVVFICAVRTMRDSWRAGVSKKDHTELVTAGIFQFSRNPAFVGFDLVYVGMVLLFFNWILFVVSVFAIMMFHLQITKVEEVFLQEEFGETYEDYCRHVNRYLGRNKR